MTSRPPEPGPRAVVVATRDPRGRADHGRVRVLRTAVEAAGRVFGRVDVFVLRPLESRPHQFPPHVRFHHLPGRGGLHHAAAGVAAARAGSGSINSALGLNRSHVEQLDTATAGAPADVWILDGVRTLSALPLAEGSQIMIDLDDLLSDRYRHWAQMPFAELPFDIVGTRPTSPVNRVTRPLRRLLPAALRYEAGRVGRLEQLACSEADTVSLVSRRECDELGRRTGRLICDLPMAVAVPPLDRRPRRELEFDAVFVGHVTHLPNLAGLHYVGSEVAPAFQRLAGRAPRIAVAGSVTPPVARWARSLGLSPLGFVPDLRALFERSAAAVAPQVVPGGVNTKILDYGRLGVPVVATADALAGLADRLSVPWCPVSSAEEFASAVIDAAHDPDASERQRVAGWNYVRANYGTQPVLERWVSALRRTLSSSPR